MRTDEAVVSSISSVGSPDGIDICNVFSWIKQPSTRHESIVTKALGGWGWGRNRHPPLYQLEDEREQLQSMRTAWPCASGSRDGGRGYGWSFELWLFNVKLAACLRL